MAVIMTELIDLIGADCSNWELHLRKANRLKKQTAVLCVAAWFLFSPLYSQSHRASVRGVIFDASGAPLKSALVRLTQEETGEVRAATTGQSGEYALASLPPGMYRMEVEAPGFRKLVRRVSLEVNQELRFDERLELGAPSEEIVITAARAPLKTDSIGLGTVIGNDQVTTLPLDGRNFLELTLLGPGASPAAPGSAASVRGDFAFSVDGAREDSNVFLLDGVYDIDPKLNTAALRPPVDAVREFEVLASTYDASFGRNGGAQVNVITRSGTNRFHGSLYEFFRNRVLDARNFFAPPREKAPQYQRNQFGASLGGPISGQRAFFFADYEGTRVREGITRVTNVPTLRERSGDFSEGRFRTPINPFTQQPFPGGRIPEPFLHPIGLKIAALYPLPNRPSGLQNFVSSPALRDRSDHFDARLDYSLNAGSQITARYSFEDRSLYDPFSGPTFAAVPGFGTQVPRRAQNVMLSETHLFSPSMVNEARIAFNRVAARSLHENQGRSINRNVGLPELSANSRDFGLSFITISGFSPLGDEFNNPQSSVTNLFQFIDGLTFTPGRHLIKSGFDFRVTQQNAFRDVQSRGFLTFSDQVPITGNALADLLLGLPFLTGGARLDNPQHLRGESYNFYLHDNLRITPRLVLSAGLRYELNSPPVDARDRANVYDSGTRSLVQVGTRGIPRSGYQSDRNNLAPRAGLAWTPWENTVLRAGYGIYYDQSALAPGEALYFNYPYFDLNLYFSLPNLPLTLSDPFPRNFPVPLPRTALAFQRDLKTAYIQHWNANLQQQLGKERIVELGYVGSRGIKLLAARDINQPRPSVQQPNLRPVPQFDDINLVESRAASSYHSLQFRFQQRLASGFSWLLSYTLSKSLDDASNFFNSAGDPNFPQDSLNVKAERGRSNFDVRNRFSLSYACEIPVGKGHRLLGDAGWMSDFLAGWQTAGIITLESGRPFSLALLPEIDRSNTGRSNLGFGANDRPNRTGSGELSNRRPEQWFQTSAFQFQPVGSFGNSGRNILDGPGYQNLNASLLKNNRVREALNVQFRAEFFNLLNHPNFDLPDIFLGSPTFGRILSAQSPRRIQFGLKLIF